MDDLAAITDHLRSLQANGLRPATVNARRQVLTTYWRTHGHLLRSPTVEITAWLANDTWKPETRRAYSVHLAGFYAWAVTTGHLTTSPTEHLRRPAVPRHLPRPISRADLDVAMAEADPRMRCWLLCMCLAGLRCGEVSRLSRRDIEPDRLWVDGKGGTRAPVPLHPRLRNALTGWPNLGRLWPVTPETVSKRVNAHLRSVGSSATAHAIRHRFATDLLDQTGDLRVVQEAMRHRDVSSTAIYTLVTDDRIFAAVLSLRAS